MKFKVGDRVMHIPTGATGKVVNNDSLGIQGWCLVETSPWAPAEYLHEDSLALVDSSTGGCECGADKGRNGAKGGHSDWCPQHPTGGRPAFKFANSERFL